MRNGQTIFSVMGVSVICSEGIHGGTFYGIVASGRLVDGLHADSSPDAAKLAVYGARSYARALRMDIE